MRKPQKKDVVVVLDVGKTNKKLLVYDRRMQVQQEERAAFPTFDYRGMDGEDTEGLLAWVKKTLRRFSEDFRVRVIAITTHGAACALLDGDGKLVHPVLSYTSPKGSEIVQDFFAAFGAERDLHRDTCTVDLGFINVGKILFYTKTRFPDDWARARLVLNYPQYLGYALTGAAGRDTTYTGNHTYLWDFAGGRHSRVAGKMGLVPMIPERLSAPWDLLGKVRPDVARECGLDAGCKVTMGIHDSNASILPYFCQGMSNFTLNSTGTWCVGMRPSEKAVLTGEELDTRTFFNLDAFGRPLKTVIFLGGLEYESFGRLTALRDECGDDDLRRVAAARDLFILPGVVADGCIFPGVKPRVVHSGRVTPLAEVPAGKHPCTGLGQGFFAALDLSLAVQTREMLRLLGAGKGEKVYIEGGFARNAAYCRALASLCPGMDFALTELREATSFGAALTGWMLAEGKDLSAFRDTFSITEQAVPPLEGAGLAEYELAWRQALRA